MTQVASVACPARDNIRHVLATTPCCEAHDVARSVRGQRPGPSRDVIASNQRRQQPFNQGAAKQPVTAFERTGGRSNPLALRARPVCQSSMSVRSCRRRRPSVAASGDDTVPRPSHYRPLIVPMMFLSSSFCSECSSVGPRKTTKVHSPARSFSGRQVA